MGNMRKLRHSINGGSSDGRINAGSGISIAHHLVNHMLWPNYMSSEKEMAFCGYGSF
jgi:hypothetical protein